MAANFANCALGHVRREFPCALVHTVIGPGDSGDACRPRELHPIFHGSYDWHSCVHGYWMLAYLARRFPHNAETQAIHSLFDQQFVAQNVLGECRYLAAAEARGFERPYGWAWLLKLVHELSLHDGHDWSRALTPLADVIVRRFRNFLPLATYPVRAGTHGNTAFALRMAADYADGAQDIALSTLIRDTAQRWYANDADCPAWGEPGGDDFQSAALIEAECMRRLLPSSAFLPWFKRFLPRVGMSEPAVLFDPVTVSDRSDGKIAHLDGLNLSRAWCWRSLAMAMAPDDPRRSILEDSAQRHLAASLPHTASDYMGEHWLASFAVLALEARA